MHLVTFLLQMFVQNIKTLLPDRNIHILDGTTVENKGELILTEIFPSAQKHDILKYLLNCSFVKIRTILSV